MRSRAAWRIASKCVVGVAGRRSRDALPATLLYVYYGVKAGGWPAIADYEQSLARNAGKLMFIGLVGSPPPWS